MKLNDLWLKTLKTTTLQKLMYNIIPAKIITGLQNLSNNHTRNSLVKLFKS